MNNITFFSIKQTDKYILDAFSNLNHTSFKLEKCVLHTFLGKNVEVQVSKGVLDIQANPQLSFIYNTNNKLVSAFEFIYSDKLTVSISRSASNEPLTNFYDKLNFILTQVHEAKFEDAASLIAIIKSKIGAIDLVDIKRKDLDEAYEKYYRQREEDLQKLQSALHSVTAEFSTARSELELDYNKRKGILESEIAKERKLLEERLKSEELTLEQRELALKERLQEIDDRDSKHARRELRQSLKQELSSRNEQFTLTTGTRNLRRYVFWTCVVLLLFIGLVFSYTLYQLYKLEQDISNWHLAILLIRQAVLALAFSGLVVFFIKWNNQWFESHAREEFRHKRFALDVDRASWIVEMALEWKKETGENIPDTFIKTLSSNLFESSDTNIECSAPLDNLSTILGASSNAKVKLPFGEIQLDRKGLNRLSKDSPKKIDEE